MKTNDIVFDPCCGTGAFLISGMNKLIDMICDSDIRNKQERMKNIKQNQLVGFEKSNTMYSLAISNMLFRGDGKSKIFNIDFFSQEADDIIKEMKPSIGFVNPPYGGSDNKTNPTKKEIQFLEKMLDCVSRYGIIIAPLSTYFKDPLNRNRILSKHTLKFVINMPNELFQPNASTHTAIAVFETNLPHNNKEVTFYNLSDDGFVLSKNKGRTDTYNKWNSIKNDLFKKLENPKLYIDDLTLTQKNILKNDEWIIQAHSKKDNSFLSTNDFIRTVKEYFIFTVKKKLNLINKNIDEITFLEILLENYSKNLFQEKDKESKIKLEKVSWKEFNYKEIFGENISRGMRLIESDRLSGEIPYHSATEFNNGLTDSISNPLFLEKDALIYTTFGKCFYVEGEFTASDEISIFKHKNLNIYSGLFFATVITSLNKYKYTFGRKAFSNKFTKDVIYLPVKSKKEIDWDFMENFIKSLPYAKYFEN
jgi:type I restriction-modification system DNA methylase subunit